MVRAKFYDYSNLTALVIDDAPVVITSIRIMLRKMGFKDENISHNKDPAAALHQAKNNIFDVFICDYNFGKLLNGKQVFEEIQHYKRLNSNSIFVMMTGESTGKVVRSIIELSPDEYMLKPYNLHTLKQRIQTALIRKQALHSLYEANANSDFEFGVDECQKLLVTHPQYLFQVKQFLGQFYRRLERLDEAKDLYQGVLAEKDYDWANVGLANTLIAQEKEQEAILLLEDILDKSPNNSHALMAMSHLNIYNDDIPSAIKHLSIASELVPGNSDRELIIANLCHAMGDYENGLQRYRTYYFTNKNTYRDTSTSILNYIRAIAYNLSGGDKDNHNTLRKESGILLSVLYKSMNTPNIISEMELIGAHLAIIDNRLSDASVLLNKVYKSNNITCFYGLLHLCFLLGKLNYKNEAEICLNNCQENIPLNEHELVAQSQLIIIKNLINENNQQSVIISDLLQKINSYEKTKNEQEVLNCYLEIHTQAPYLQKICFEIIRNLTKIWPLNWTSNQVRGLIEECNNTIEQIMPENNKEAINYYFFYNKAKTNLKLITHGR